MTTPQQRTGERLAIVETEVKHLRDDINTHRDETKDIAKKQENATNALSAKMDAYHLRLAIISGVFMFVVAIILGAPKLAEALRLLNGK